MPDRPLTPEATNLVHGSCRHVNADGWLVVVTVDGILTTPRRADQYEKQCLTSFGKLCFAVKS